MSVSIWWLPGRFRKHYLRPLVRYLTDRETYRRAYDSARYFDQFHTLGEADVDGDTIAPGYPSADAAFHYNAVENGIIAHFKENRIEPDTVLDIGSGSGHWIEFYSSVYRPGVIYGTDISAESVRRLQKRFEAKANIHIHHTDLLSFGAWDGPMFDVVNAIGVMFHIVDDGEWIRTIQWFADQMKPGGVLVVGGLFGPFTANVQFSPVRFDSREEMEQGAGELACNKRVRSRRKWKRALKSCGFDRVTFRRTTVPRSVNTPENNLLFAVKSSDGRGARG